MLVDVSIRRVIGSIVSLLCVLVFCAEVVSPAPSVSVVSTSPEYFIQNCGQWPDSILFQTKVNGAVVWFGRSGLYYQLFKRNEAEADSSDQNLTRLVHEELVGANTNAEVTSEDESGYRCNYFLGNDSTKWTTDVPTFASIRFHDVYPGVDLRYYYRNGHLEYDFLLSPNADPLAIQIKYIGIDSLITGAAGELIVATDWGKIIQRPPTVYEATTGRPVACEYRIEANSFGFSLPPENRQIAIVIDPFLAFSSYWGGSADDYGCGIGLDPSGNVYVTGKTSSADFPTRLAVDETKDVDWDGYVTKFSPNCRDYLYSTFYGGGGADVGTEIAVTSFGEPVIGGGTQSYDLPSISAAQPIKGTDVDGFVLKLNPTGNEIEFATFLGNSRRDSVTGVAIGPNGHVYVSGFTFSDNFVVTRDAYQRYSGWYTYGFIVELPPTGDSLIYSSYFACQSDRTKVAVDLDGNIILSGRTMPDRFSVQFPLKNAFDTTKGGSFAGFITKFSPGFDSLVFSTFIGGDEGTALEAMTVDSEGKIYVAGSSSFGGYPLLNSLEGRFEHYHEGVVSIVGPTGDLQFSTLWGNYEYSRDELQDIALDGNNNVYLLGHYDGTSYRLTNAFDSVNGWFEGAPSLEATITKFSPMGGSVEYCSFLGGYGIDSAGALVVSRDGTVYVIGTNQDGGFPMVNPLDDTFQGAADFNTDAYVAIVSDQLTDVDDSDNPALPVKFTLHQNYPNPFNNETVIQFDLPQATKVELNIYNILGEKVRTVVSKRYSAGSHRLSWNGTDDNGSPVASGVYFFEASTERQQTARKMILLR